MTGSPQSLWGEWNEGAVWLPSQSASHAPSPAASFGWLQGGGQHALGSSALAGLIMLCRPNWVIRKLTRDVLAVWLARCRAPHDLIWFKKFWWYWRPALCQSTCALDLTGTLRDQRRRNHVIHFLLTSPWVVTNQGPHPGGGKRGPLQLQKNPLRQSQWVPVGRGQCPSGVLV